MRVRQRQRGATIVGEGVDGVANIREGGERREGGHDDGFEAGWGGRRARGEDDKGQNSG
jgi:hypothetical protein